MNFLNKKTIENRRALLMLGIQSIGLTAIASRLFYLQVKEKELYGNLAENNRIKINLLPPNRGIIVDRNEIIIGDNKQVFSVNIRKKNDEDFNNDLNYIKILLDLSDKDINKSIKEIGKNGKHNFSILKDNINWNEVSMISTSMPYLKNINISKRYGRHYPFHESTGNFLGYVARPSKKDKLKFNNPLLNIPHFFVGKSGLEVEFENQLRGQSGFEKIEVNAYGKKIKVIETTKPISGEKTKISIDIELQNYIQEILKPHKSASAVVMDIKTGELHALVTQPNINPNDFVSGLSIEKWNKIKNDPYNPLLNKPIRGIYAPGSVFKIIVAIAILKKNNGTVKSEKCFGYHKLGRNSRIHCWKKGGHGTVNLKKSITESCDVFYYKNAAKLTMNEINNVARELGLGKSYDIGIEKGKSGLLPSDHWKLKRFGFNWSKTDTVLASIGQGYVLSTPIQLAVMAARIANGEKKVKPTLMTNINNNTHIDNFENININNKYLEIVKKGMFSVVNEKKGTAWHSRTRKWIMAGKTGTSQVRKISKKERAKGVTKNEDLEWKKRDHSLFSCFTPYKNPKFAISVVLDHGGKGASDVAKNIVNKLSEIHS